MYIEDIYYEDYFPNWIKKSIGEFIGAGEEGHVYHFGNDRVIKIASLGEGFKRTWKDIEKVLTRLQSSPQDDMVRIYKFGKLCSRPVVYYYIAEKLEDLPYVEADIIDNIVDSNRIITSKKENSHYTNHFPDLMNFLRCLLDKNKIFKVCDVHGGNVMVDKNYKYKLSDLGLIKIKE